MEVLVAQHAFLFDGLPTDGRLSRAPSDSANRVLSPPAPPQPSQEQAYHAQQVHAQLLHIQQPHEQQLQPPQPHFERPALQPSSSADAYELDTTRTSRPSSAHFAPASSGESPSVIRLQQQLTISFEQAPLTTGRPTQSTSSIKTRQPHYYHLQSQRSRRTLSASILAPPPSLLPAPSVTRAPPPSITPYQPLRHPSRPLEDAMCPSRVRLRSLPLQGRWTLPSLSSLVPPLLCTCSPLSCYIISVPGLPERSDGCEAGEFAASDSGQASNEHFVPTLDALHKIIVNPLPIHVRRLPS